MLTILKIIGICILAILAIILLILFTLLFVPVRYRSSGKLCKDDRQVVAKASYLAYAISAVVRYRDGNLSWTVKVFGTQILPKKGQHRPAEKKRSSGKQPLSGGEKKAAKKSVQTDDQNAKQTTKDGHHPTGESTSSESENQKRRTAARTGTPEESNASESENPEESTASESGNPEESTASESRSPGENTASESESPGENTASDREKTDENNSDSFFGRFFQEIRDLIQRIRERIVLFRKRTESLWTRLKEYKKQAERWKKFYHLKETQVTLGVLKTELKKLICYLLPTRIRARIHFGFDDPADTGIALGAISSVYGFFPKGIVLEPNFEGKVLEGEWKLRGRIRLIYFVRLALRLLLREENRMTYQRLRKLMARSGHEV